MSTHLHQKSRGFTLIETVIIIAFSVVMLLTITLLVYSFNKISAENQASSSSSGSARALMREIESFAGQADAVLATHTFASTPRSTSSTELVLEIPSIDGAGAVIPAAHDYVAFYVTGTNAYRILEKSASSSRSPGTKLLSTTLSSLTFSFDNAAFSAVRVVTTDLQTLTTVKQDILTDHLAEQIRLRNR